MAQLQALDRKLLGGRACGLQRALLFRSPSKQQQRRRPQLQQQQSRFLAIHATAGAARELWVQTTSQSVLTAAVESGHSTVVFGADADGSVRSAFAHCRWWLGVGARCTTGIALIASSQKPLRPLDSSRFGNLQHTSLDCCPPPINICYAPSLSNPTLPPHPTASRELAGTCALHPTARQS